MWTYSYKLSAPESLYNSISEFLESDCGSTDKPSTVGDPWADSGTPTASGKSETTQPTKSSLKDVSKYSPSHYQRGKIQVWDFISDQNFDFLTGNVVKYVCRAGLKDYESELDDLLKAKAYIEKKIAKFSEGRNR